MQRKMLGINEPHEFTARDLITDTCALCGQGYLSAVHFQVRTRTQVGGDHYRTPTGIPEHWDIAWALGWDFFQYQITKYIWRWKDKGGIQDLRKAQDFLRKYIALCEEKEKQSIGMPFAPPTFDTGEPLGRGYVDQDHPPSGPAGPTSADAPPVESASGGPPNHLTVIDEHGRRHDYKRIT